MTSDTNAAPFSLDSDDRLITADELKRATGIPAGTWRWWAAAERGPESFKINGRRFWRRNAVNRWLAEQQQNPSRPPPLAAPRPAATDPLRTTPAQARMRRVPPPPQKVWPESTDGSEARR